MKKSLIFHKQQSNLNNKNIVVLVSGGVDSMVLLDNIYQIFSNKMIKVVHINYGKRPADNIIEISLIKKYCNKRDIKYYIFEYSEFGSSNFQEDARNFRYNYAHRIAIKESNSVIVTAHTSNDVLETYFIKNIQKRNKNNITINEKSSYKNVDVYRPFYDTWKDEIIEYSSYNNIDYVEDSSNSSKKYLRNRIRIGLNRIDISTKQKWKSQIDKKNKEKYYINILGTNIDKYINSKDIIKIVSNMLNEQHIYKRYGYINELINLLKGFNKSKQLLIDKNKYFVIINNRLHIYNKSYIHRRKLIYYETLKYSNLNIELFYDLIKPEYYLLSYNNNKRKVLKVLKNKKIPKIIRDNTFVIVDNNNRVYDYDYNKNLL